MLHVTYGQRTAIREERSFRRIAERLGVARQMVIPLESLGRMGGSSLTDRTMTVPRSNGRRPDDIPTSYVPFRNTVLVSLAVAWAEVLEAQAVFIGANVFDNPGYPDCRPAYFEAFNQLIDLGTRPETRIKIKTPLIHLDKAGIVRLGLDLKAPFELTWSCYLNEDQACGRCSSCVLRLRGFAAAGATDPIPYQQESLPLSD